MRRRQAFISIASLVGTSALAQVLSSAGSASAPSTYETWKESLVENERDRQLRRELRREAQEKLRSEYELRSSVTHFVVGLSATALVAGLLLRRKLRAALGIACIGILVTALSWNWFQMDSVDVKLVRCQEKAARHPTEIGTQMAFATCEKLYGSP
jgi:hypothetical protein